MDFYLLTKSEVTQKNIGTASSPAFSTAAFTAIAPNRGAGTLHIELLKDPIGVLTALTITTSYVNNERQIQVVYNNNVFFFGLTEGTISFYFNKIDSGIWAQSKKGKHTRLVLGLGMANKNFGSEV